jgi:hypothetical protein
MENALANSSTKVRVTAILYLRTFCDTKLLTGSVIKQEKAKLFGLRQGTYQNAPLAYHSGRYKKGRLSRSSFRQRKSSAPLQQDMANWKRLNYFSQLK